MRLEESTKDSASLSSFDASLSLSMEVSELVIPLLVDELIIFLDMFVFSDNHYW